MVAAGAGAPAAGGPADAGGPAAAADPAGETVGLPEAKSYPQVSQNCPDLMVPHCGQGSAGASDPADAGAGPDAGPEPPEPGSVRAGAGAAPPIRIPQTSQKSGSVLSWPAGQVGMPASLTSWSGPSWLTWYRAPSRRRRRPSSSGAPSPTRRPPR